jgi:hypothetical protein
MDSPSFETLISDCECQIASSGFTTTLAVPQYGWSEGDEDASEDPHPAQKLAAYQIFMQFFISNMKKVWVHLGAEMQAGKTGVVATLIRLILSNFRTLSIRPSHIFVITGMSDMAWKKQTKERLIGDVRNGVEHSNGLNRIASEIRKIHARCGELRDIFIIMDESHIASSNTNRPNSVVFNTIKELCPRDSWVENNIRFLTISATDPAKVLDITTSADKDCAVVRLQTTEAYQSVESLIKDARVKYLESDVHEEWAMSRINNIIRGKYINKPLYHIIRPKKVNYERAIHALRENFPTANIIQWDSSSNVKKTDENASLTSDCDINNILEETPSQTTFVILKNMFYAAKTLKDQNVGILFDRIGGKDDTNLQSLLGRACGYGKSKRTYVFTSKQTCDNYTKCWKELSSKRGFPEKISSIPVKEINMKMPNVRAFKTSNGTSIASTVHSPFVSIAAGGGGDSLPEIKPKNKANEDHFNSEWREFDSFEDAKKWAHRIQEKTKNEDGFLLSSTTKGVEVLSYDAVMGMKAGKKTANMPWSSLEIGKTIDRLYVAYKDTSDVDSAVFVVRRLTRLV